MSARRSSFILVEACLGRIYRRSLDTVAAKKQTEVRDFTFAFRQVVEDVFAWTHILRVSYHIQDA